MANAINDIIKQSVNNITNIQQANQQLQSILGQSQNQQTTGSYQLPSDMVLSPSEVSWYNTLMTEDPTSSKHKHGKVVATYLSGKVPAQIEQMENPSNYPELTNILSNLSKQGQSGLQGYISNQQNLAPSLFANTWETPNKDTSSISLSLAGNQPKNKIMQEYEGKYNEMQQQLDTQKQNYLSQLDTMRTNIQNSLQQLANPDTAKALILGSTATYLQNIYNRISPYLDQKSYQQLTQQMQDIYSKDQQFATSYNQLFQNYLGMNANLIDMLKQIQSNTFGGMQQGAQQATQQLSQLGGQQLNVPNVTDMGSAIKAQGIQNTANNQIQDIQFANTHFGLTPTNWQAYIRDYGQEPTSQEDADRWQQWHDYYGNPINTGGA
jgi:hypothetical protein